MGRAIVAGGKPDMAAPVTGILASDLAVGSVVKLMEDGVATEYLVVNQGIPSGSSLYDASCDGTWLLRKDIKENRQWHSSNVNDYANSDIHAWLNGDFFNLFGTVEQAAIKQVNIPYRAGSGYDKTVTSGLSGLSANVFLISATEVSLNNSNMPTNEGAELSYFAGCLNNDNDSKRIAYLNETATSWSLRSPLCNSYYNDAFAIAMNNFGGPGSYRCADTAGIRPCLILNPTSVFDEETMLLKGVA